MAARRKSNFGKRKPKTVGRTLAAARVSYFALLDEGVTCPCCDRYGKEYERKLNSNMARFLCSLVRVYLAQGDESGVHHTKLAYTGRDYSYILLWGLATTEEAGEDDAGSMSGLWRPTPRGVRFAHNKMRVKSHVRVYNNARLEYRGDLVSVQTCLGKHFDYRELMASPSSGRQTP